MTSSRIAEPKSRADNFHAYLLRDAEFTDIHELPALKAVHIVPQRLIPLSVALRRRYRQPGTWVCFYDAEEVIERVWNNPRRYLKVFRRYAGIVSPDYSQSPYAPSSYLFIQTYRGLALAAWYQENGIPVIPNVRYVGLTSEDFCCEAIPHNSVIAIGTLGCLRNREKHGILLQGLDFIISAISPSAIVVYGGCPNDILTRCIRKRIEVIQFDAQTKKSKDKCVKEKAKRLREHTDTIQGRLF